MLEKLKSLFSDSATESHRPSLQLCVGVLLVETAKADFDYSAGELARIIEILQERFNLSEPDIATLVDLAKGESNQAVSLHDYVKVINEQCDLRQREEILEFMWQVAHQDRLIDKYEEQLIRKVSELLYIPHEGFIRTKLKVLGDA